MYEILFLFVGLSSEFVRATSKINDQLGFYLFINVASPFRSFVSSERRYRVTAQA